MSHQNAVEALLRAADQAKRAAEENYEQARQYRQAADQCDATANEAIARFNSFIQAADALTVQDSVGEPGTEPTA